MRKIITRLMLLLAIVIPSVTYAQWTNEQVIYTTNLYSTLQTSPKAVCANFAAQQVIDCVYPNYATNIGQTSIFEIQSIDGGVSWGSPSQVSSDYSYDPFIEYDSNRQRFNLIYTQNTGGKNNNIVIRYKSSPSGAWSSATTIALGSSSNEYWIPSVLTLLDGNMNAYFTVNGPESASGVGSGRIMVSRSTDGGNTWTAPSTITSTCDAEYARAIENSNGSILLVYSRYVANMTSSPCQDGTQSNGYAYTNIHQIWSSNDGQTWTGESTLYHNPNGSAMHPYVGAETTHRQSSCASCQWDVLWEGQTSSGSIAAFEQQSTNQGTSWGSPQQISQTTWSTVVQVDPGAIIGCRGFFTFYTDTFPNQNIYDRRYDWSSTCSIN